MRFNSLFLIIVAVLVSCSALQAQGISRSGFPAPVEDLQQLRRFPCGGITLLDEKLDSMAFPTAWSSEDLDGGTPREEIRFLVGQKGWQVVKDLKDTTNGNLIFASASWYEEDTAANDWLILPQATNLPPNTCLSWYAYSADEFFPEDYEVWISTAGNTPDDFLNTGTMLDSIAGEGIEFTFRTLSLADFAGQDVYVAFRHTSKDKFVLGLDEIRMAQVEELDLAIFSIDEIRAKPDEEINISGSFINRGLDTIRYDTSNFLNIFYSIDAQDTNRFAYPFAFALAPNDTLNFVHDSIWIPEESRVYRLIIWLDQTPGDNKTENDTVGIWQGIGTATSVGGKVQEGIKVFPNPASYKLNIEISQEEAEWEAVLLDHLGRKVIPAERFFQERGSLNLEGLSRGIYFLQVRSGPSILATQKILVE